MYCSHFTIDCKYGNGEVQESNLLAVTSYYPPEPMRTVLDVNAADMYRKYLFKLQSPDKGGSVRNKKLCFLASGEQRHPM